MQEMKRADLGAVLKIYSEGIASGNATFETSAPGEEAWDKIHLSNCRLIARSGEEVIGWAALSPVSGRCTYSGVAEVSVYVTAGQREEALARPCFQSWSRNLKKPESGLWMPESSRRTKPASLFTNPVVSGRLVTGRSWEAQTVSGGMSYCMNEEVRKSASETYGAWITGRAIYLKGVVFETEN